MQATYDAITALTDAFCRDHLNEEYRDLARAMTAALCRKRPNPLASGQPRTWACGIIHVLDQLNFLSDKFGMPGDSAPNCPAQRPLLSVDIRSNQRCTRGLSLRATLNRIHGEGSS